MKPIDAEIPQVPRHCRQSEQKRADQERARGPINSLDRDAELQSVISYQLLVRYLRCDR